MKKLAFGALIVGLFAACGGSSGKSQNSKTVMVLDSNNMMADASQICNPLTQTGCMAGQKCTWVTDQTMPNPLGHVDCVPDGTVDTGGACTVGAPGATGYDNCKAGNYCLDNVCKTICDPAGGSPMCPMNFGCSAYDGLFGTAGMASTAGVCDPSCDPLADNKFGATKTKTGTACSATQGCYGYPNSAAPSHYSCTHEPTGSTMLYHRTQCTTANGCANSSGPYLNGCAQGFIPLLFEDDLGNMQVDCISLCQPVDCSTAGCGTAGANLKGMAGHACQSSTTTDSAGTFNVASLTNNGDQCMYSWLFEIDSTTGTFTRSPTSDTVGFCVDHNRYHYDSNGDGMLTSADLHWPSCNTLSCPVGGSNCFGNGSAVAGVCNDANGCIHAGDFGCISTAIAKPFGGKSMTLKTATLIERPRVPFNHNFAR